MSSTTKGPHCGKEINAGEENKLSQDMQLVAFSCGRETVKLLMDKIPGVTIYVPTPRKH